MEWAVGQQAWSAWSAGIVVLIVGDKSNLKGTSQHSTQCRDQQAHSMSIRVLGAPGGSDTISQDHERRTGYLRHSLLALSVCAVDVPLPSCLCLFPFTFPFLPQLPIMSAHAGEPTNEKEKRGTPPTSAFAFALTGPSPEEAL